MSNDEIVSRTRLLDSEIKVCFDKKYIDLLGRTFACLYSYKTAQTVQLWDSPFSCTNDVNEILM